MPENRPGQQTTQLPNPCEQTGRGTDLRVNKHTQRPCSGMHRRDIHHWQWAGEMDVGVLVGHDGGIIVGVEGGPGGNSMRWDGGVVIVYITV